MIFLTPPLARYYFTYELTLRIPILSSLLSWKHLLTLPIADQVMLSFSTLLPSHSHLVLVCYPTFPELHLFLTLLFVYKEVISTSSTNSLSWWLPPTPSPTKAYHANLSVWRPPASNDSKLSARRSPSRPLTKTPKPSLNFQSLKVDLPLVSNPRRYFRIWRGGR